jgi:uncharacterized membrane protein YfhO
VVLENPDAPELPLSGAVRDGDPLGSPYGEVRLVGYKAGTVDVEATTNGGYLVLTDAYYPGWRAYVDGAETPLYRGDYLFRAVALPPGRHLVQFRYEPASFATGLTISRLAAALAALGVIVSFAPRSRLARLPWLRAP